MNRAIIVFAKEPLKGAVKTRLKGCLSEAEIIGLYKAFVMDTLTLAGKIKNTRRILAIASDGIPRYLKSVGAGFEMFEQSGRTLGERIYNAFCYANEKKPVKTVIIGTDSPTLPSTLIEKAFKALKRKDVVIGPSADGGYYLIGMKKPCPEIFKGVRWSSASVLKKTMANAESAKITTALLDEWYDVDDYDGLQCLKADLESRKSKKIAQNTREFLKGGK